MEQPNLSEHLRFADMVASTTEHTEPTWVKNSQTHLAHATGRLPQKTEQIGWQPIAGPGAASTKAPLSRSMQSLLQRIVRGEA